MTRLTRGILGTYHALDAAHEGGHLATTRCRQVLGCQAGKAVIYSRFYSLLASMVRENAAPYHSGVFVFGHALESDRSRTRAECREHHRHWRYRSVGEQTIACAGAATARPQADYSSLAREDLQRTADSARSNKLPTTFFIRLLYQESSFKLGVISSAGALGIAQFMPETAANRGVDNPLDAMKAIPASAELLRDLYMEFGNLGLAAAAYNAGPKRIQDWLAKRASLPPETQKYVKTVTGGQRRPGPRARLGASA
jgi:Transglycosylase SLT domain